MMVAPRHAQLTSERPRLVAVMPAAVGALLALVAVGWLLATPAAAHSDLTSSTPTSGATVDSAPAVVELVFNEEIAQTGLQVVAQGPAGSLPLGTPVVSGTTVTSPWPQNAGGGDFRVSYRVVSADGHPIDGTITFTVAGAAAARPSDSAASADASSGSAEPVTAAATEATSGAADSSGFPLWIPAVVVVVGVVIGAAIARALRSRRSSQTPHPTGTPPDSL